jgi:8-oxo-dGTP diphosphatase/2-hydroxy-dATP diphosphatase
MKDDDAKDIQTLCIIHAGSRMLLGKKKRGLGAGKWNGFGGHVEADESIEEAARREVKEECGLVVNDLEKIGLVIFISPIRTKIEAHIFKATDYEGEPVETEEMSPEWFTKDTVPFTEMWPSDLYWWPYFVKNRKFTGEIEFDTEDRVVSHEIRPAVTLPA